MRALTEQHPYALDDRFWSKVQVTEQCWEWLAARNDFGYGLFWIDGAMQLAHRVSYGAVPGSPELDHLCRNHACVRPDHLEPVSHAENMARGHWAMKTRCPWGHEYTAENTFIVKRTGHRQCRACACIRTYLARVKRGEQGQQMSKWDYDVATRILAGDPEPSFAGLIMAAMQRADTTNAAMLRSAFPDVWAEVDARYNAPGGILPGELDGLPVRNVPDRAL